MSFVDGDPKKQEVAERMSRLVGLPITSVNSLIAAATPEDLERLHGLEDSEFKTEAVRLVNKAQQQQFAAMGKGDGPSGPGTLKISPGPAAAPASPGSAPVADGAPQMKKLVIPKAPGDGPPSGEVAPTAAPPSLKLPSQSGGSGLQVPSGASSLSTPSASAPSMSLPGTSAPLRPAEPSAEQPSGEGQAKPTVAAAPDNPQPTIAATPDNPAGPAEPAKKATLRVATDNRTVGGPAVLQPNGPGGPGIPGAPARPGIPGGPSGPGGPGQATGISSAEPGQRKPLSISPAEAEEIAKDVPAHGKAADLTSQGGSKNVSSAFKAKSSDKSKSMDKKTLWFMIGISGAGVVVVVLLAVVLFSVLKEDPVVVPPKTRPPKIDPTQQQIAEDKGFVGKWAWRHTKSFEQTFSNEKLLQGNSGTSFTVECWVKVERLSGVEYFQLTTGAGEKFVLGFRQSKRRVIAYFDVAESHRRKSFAQGTFPTGEGWVHLAGTYNPRANQASEKKFRLFVNGIMVKEKSISKDPVLMSTTYKLACVITGEGSAVIIDGIRMSEGVLYKGDFKPVRNFKKERSTVCLLHMEKNKDGTILDYARGDQKLYIQGGEWVAVDTERFALARDMAAELEKRMFDVMEKKLTPERFQRFKATWRKASAADRQKLIEQFKELERASGKGVKQPNTPKKPE